MPRRAVKGPLKTALFTLASLVAFAANSIICRLALKGETIDAASFSTIRLASGALVLLGIATFWGKTGRARQRGDWFSASMLFLYAVAFSFAYVSLGVGTGALLLFGAVQATMILGSWLSDERPRPIQWTGLSLALGGLVWLVFPGLNAPSLEGAILMAAAGIAWGIYSLRGRGKIDPVRMTTKNFVRSAPLALVVTLVMVAKIHLSAKGVFLAIFSGSLASGIGYVAWYAALRGLTAVRAAMVQLSVPVLAALGGVIFLSETVSMRLFISAGAILIGVGLFITGQEPFGISETEIR
jgi:drug/metabolite transporter (DMT)-like permease